MAGLYIHIPYCRHRCLYCDFFTGGASIARWDALADSLIAEMETRRDELNEPLSTIYFGGGTPSMMPPGELERLVGAIRDIAGGHWEVEEATIELNPDDVTPDTLRRWLSMGFNRLSLGVQTLSDPLLRRIGRRHDADTARRAMTLIADTDADLSVDLMFGLPGLTDATWRGTIEEVLTYRPQHLSAYALMYEPGTALTALRDAGRLAEASDTEYEQQYSTLTDLLTRAGYRHYETSNYSLPGHHSRHNTLYWSGVPYIGLGPGAHSYDGRRLRRANLPDLHGYLARPGEPPHETEHLTDEMLRDEYLLTRLRMADGIDLADFRRRFGPDATARLLEAARPLSRRGDITLPPARLTLTPASILIGDTLIATLAAEL